MSGAKEAPALGVFANASAANALDTDDGLQDAYGHAVAHLVLQACGLLASGASMSFAKWLLDEELCAHIRW